MTGTTGVRGVDVAMTGTDQNDGRSVCRAKSVREETRGSVALSHFNSGLFHPWSWIVLLLLAGLVFSVNSPQVVMELLQYVLYVLSAITVIGFGTYFGTS
jgi:hypothetical protein